MKKYLFFAVIILAVALIAALKQAEYANKKWQTAMVNVKAYAEQLDSSKKQNTAFQLTIDQLEYYQDSILKKLDETRKQLKVKNKNLQSVHYIASSFTRTDTILLKDTIFKEPSFVVDTLLGDEWYKVQVGLKYPSMVSVSPEFRSEKHVVVSTKKETVNPPKKFFLWRWLQKKMTVVHVDVVEKNPYVNNQTSRYIEIIK